MAPCPNTPVISSSMIAPCSSTPPPSNHLQSQTATSNNRTLYLTRCGYIPPHFKSPKSDANLIWTVETVEIKPLSNSIFDAGMERVWTTCMVGLEGTPNCRNVERSMPELLQTSLLLWSWRIPRFGWPSTRGRSRQLATYPDPTWSCLSWVRSRQVPTMGWPMRRLLQSSQLSLLFVMRTSCAIAILREKATSMWSRGSSPSWNGLNFRTTC